MSIVRGKHTFKTGGEWMHTLNDQVFRGFFTGRYIFDSVTGFLRYASPAAAGGFGPRTRRLPERRLRHRADSLSERWDPDQRSTPPLSAGRQPHRPGDRRHRRIEDRQRGVRAVRAGSMAAGERSDDQLRPALGCPADARDHRSPIDGVRCVPERPGIPVRRHHPGSVGDGAAARSASRGTSCGTGKIGRARQRRRLLGAPEHAVAGRIGDHQRRAAADAVREHGAGERVRCDDAGVARPADVPAVPPGQFPLFSGVRVFHKDYKNPRVYAYNIAYEQELMPDFAGYVDFTWNAGTQPHPIPELQPQRAVVLRGRSGDGQHLCLQRIAVGTAAR